MNAKNDSANVMIENAVQGLRNEDVSWQGTTLGLIPTIENRNLHSLVAAGQPAVIPLINSLLKVDSFVAAHVILTFIAGHSNIGPGWNGLSVDLGSDGSVSINPEQRTALQMRWRKWVETK